MLTMKQAQRIGLVARTIGKPKTGDWYLTQKRSTGTLVLRQVKASAGRPPSTPKVIFR